MKLTTQIVAMVVFAVFFLMKDTIASTITASGCDYSSIAGSCDLEINPAFFVDSAEIVIKGLSNDRDPIAFTRNLSGSTTNWFAESGMNTLNLLDYNGRFFGSLSSMDHEWLNHIHLN